MSTHESGGAPDENTAAKVEPATGPHGSAQDVDLAAVYRYAAPLLTGVGPVPALGSPRWCELDDADRRKHAAVVIAALSRIVLPADPAAEIQADADVQEHKQTAEAISAAVDWSVIASRPSHAELQRRRAEPGPLAHTVDPAEVRRWVAAGSSRAEGRAVS